MIILRKVKNQQTRDWIDNMVIFLMTIYYAMTFIWANVAWGRFVFIGLALLVFLMYALKNKGKIKLRYYPLYGCLLLFTIYSLSSSIWAWTPSLSMDKARSLFELLIITCLMSMYMYKHLSIDDALNILLWGGILVAIYALMYYGLNRLIVILNSGIRMNTEFENVNSLSTCWVISIVIAIYKALHQRKIWLWGVVVCMVILIAAAASRKAFISLSVGILMVIFVKYRGKNTIQTSFRFVILGAVLLVVVYFLMQSFVFSGILGRMSSFFDFFSGESYRGQAESRYRYILIGIEQWKRTPIFGIGIANSPTLLGTSGERYTYLHNNFVELLACGGIVGFILFYVRYLQLTEKCVKSIRNRTKNELDWLVLTFIVLMLLLDYGAVSYTTKQHYMQFMLLYTYVYSRNNESVQLQDDNCYS